MKIIVNLVKGTNGYSLQIVDNNGSGTRIAGAKAWGNPYNRPTASFTLDSDELIKCIRENEYLEVE